MYLLTSSFETILIFFFNILKKKYFVKIQNPDWYECIKVNYILVW